jgi:hypothetical protein
MNPSIENPVTDPPPRRKRLLASTSSKIAAGLFAVIALASISMVIAAARKSTHPSPRTTAAASTGTHAMPPPASAPHSALAPSQRAQVAFQVVSRRPGGRITGRVLQPIDPTTLTRTDQTITIALQPGVTREMGSAADVKPGALLQADGAIGNDGTLRAGSLVVLTGYVHLR